MTCPKKNWHRQLSFLILSLLLLQCIPDERREQQQGEAKTATDTIEVTSFSIERKNNSPELDNWAVFEVGQEIICTPPGWTAHQKDTELIILPPDSRDSIERVTFARFTKDNHSLNYSVFARTMAEAAFDEFITQKNDTLSQLIFRRNFAYERTVNLSVHKTVYEGYCMIYVDEKYVYKYRIIIAENRLKYYRGDLFKDIIGNLQVNQRYLFGNDNPIKQVIILN